MSAASKWLKGQLLLDGGELQGSYFHRSVVLICHHDADGAFGLVLNRGSGKKVGDTLVAHLADSLKEQELFLGGPVQQGALSYLHADAFLPSANVLPNLTVGHSLDDLVELGESYAPSRQIRIFAGYAGWSPGQLEDEMNRKAWVTHPASLDLIFAAEPAQLWKHILIGKGWRYKLLTDAPDDLSLN